MRLGRWPLALGCALLVGVTFVATRPVYRPVDDLYATLPELREVARVDTANLTASLRSGPVPLKEALARVDRLARTTPFWRKEPMPGQYNFTPNPPWWAVRFPFLARFDNHRVVHVQLDAGVPVDMDHPSAYRTPKGPYATLRAHSWSLKKPPPIGDLIRVGNWTVMPPGLDR